MFEGKSSILVTGQKDVRKLDRMEKRDALGGSHKRFEHTNFVNYR